MASRTSADPGIPVRAVAGESMTLSDLIALLKRRKRYIFASLAFFLCLATLYCTIATRQYDAEGVIQIQKESSSMDLSSVLSAGDVAGGASDSLDTTIILQTQVSILESDTLALQVMIPRPWIFSGRSSSGASRWNRCRFPSTMRQTGALSRSRFFRIDSRPRW
jgi:hypothetical protein